MDHGKNSSMNTVSIHYLNCAISHQIFKMRQLLDIKIFFIRLWLWCKVIALLTKNFPNIILSLTC